MKIYNLNIINDKLGDLDVNGKAHPVFQGDECGGLPLALQSRPRRTWLLRYYTAWRRPPCSSTSWGSPTTPSATRWSAAVAGPTASAAPTASRGRSSSKGGTTPSRNVSGTSAGLVAAASTIYPTRSSPATTSHCGSGSLCSTSSA